MPNKIEISYKTISFTILLLLSVWFLFFIRDIIYLVFISFILMSAFKPWTDYLDQHHIPRTVGIFIIYLLLIALIGFIATSITPLLVSESQHLSQNLPIMINTYLPFVKLDSQLLSQQITPIGENIVKLTIGIFSNVFSLFTIFVISFYLLLERKNLESHLVFFMGNEVALKVIVVVRKVEERLGAWVRGQISLIAVIGVFTFIGLWFLRIPYALPLAIIAGLLEIIPTIGPIISAIPGVLVALTISPFMGIIVALLYFIVQQVENHLVVPYVMNRVVGLPPVVTIVALMIGAKLAGIGGALLSVPVVVTAETITSQCLKIKEKSR